MLQARFLCLTLKSESPVSTEQAGGEFKLRFVPVTHEEV